MEFGVTIIIIELVIFFVEYLPEKIREWQNHPKDELRKLLIKFGVWVVIPALIFILIWKI